MKEKQPLHLYKTQRAPPSNKIQTSINTSAIHATLLDNRIVVLIKFSFTFTLLGSKTVVLIERSTLIGATAFMRLSLTARLSSSSQQLPSSTSAATKRTAATATPQPQHINESIKAVSICATPLANRPTAAFIIIGFN
jgi:hypothetical protein